MVQSGARCLDGANRCQYCCLVQLGASIVVCVVVLCYVVLLNARLFVGAVGCLYFSRCKYLVMKYKDLFRNGLLK